jgi:hypothetical protein
MTSTPSERSVPVSISAADAATEVLIISSDRVKVAAAFGKLETELMPGFYKVRYQGGAITDDRLFAVRSDPVTLRGDPLQIHTPVPLRDTATTHEYHEDAASRTRTLKPVKCGAGSEIAVLARDSQKKRDIGRPRGRGKGCAWKH